MRDSQIGKEYLYTMITSRISSKAKITLSKAVGAALGVKNGGQLAYELKA